MVVSETDREELNKIPKNKGKKYFFPVLVKNGG
jgi:hypothetical protein